MPYVACLTLEQVQGIRTALKTELAAKQRQLVDEHEAREYAEAENEGLRAESQKQKVIGIAGGIGAAVLGAVIGALVTLATHPGSK